MNTASLTALRPIGVAGNIARSGLAAPWRTLPSLSAGSDNVMFRAVDHFTGRRRAVGDSCVAWSSTASAVRHPVQKNARKTGLLGVGVIELSFAGTDPTRSFLRRFVKRSSTEKGISVTDLAQRIADDGFAAVRNVVPARTLCNLRASIETACHTDDASVISNSSGPFGLRNLSHLVPEVGRLSSEPTVKRILQKIFDAPAFLVRATLFDKTDGANWGVFWHQDLAIAVKQRIDVPGFRSWTRKAGVTCVQPPSEIMERIRAIRIHLDDCGKDRGALRVLPGTHRSKRLSDQAVQTQRSSACEVVCEASAGDALVMCPLLLHASSPMKTGGRRRVIHLEYADFHLPSQLEWFHSNPATKSA